MARIVGSILSVVLACALLGAFPERVSAQAPPLADCWVCQACFNGHACCAGNEFGGSDCAQQSWGCYPYGNYCAVNVAMISPEGAFNLPQADSELDGALAFTETEVVSPGAIVIRMSCNGNVVRRLYAVEVRRAKLALSDRITI